jgi:formate dehydrogenase subunit gamma
MTPSQEQTLSECIQQHVSTPGGLLPLLHAVQEAAGYIPDDAVPVIARAFNQSQAEIRGVISFYHDFHSTPPAAHTLRLCMAEACVSMGASQLADELNRQLGVKDGESTPDKQLQLRSVYCLGACACAPALELDGKLYARIDTQKLVGLLATCKADRAC